MKDSAATAMTKLAKPKKAKACRSVEVDADDAESEQRVDRRIEPLQGDLVADHREGDGDVEEAAGDGRETRERKELRGVHGGVFGPHAAPVQPGAFYGNSAGKRA